MNLFQYEPTHNLLPFDGIVNYYGPILASCAAQDYLEALLRTVPWKNDEAVICGKQGSPHETGLAQQRYAKSHRILANCLGVKDFGDSGIPKTRPVLVGQFWGLDSDRILKLVLREIILSQNVSPHGVYQMHRFN